MKPIRQATIALLLGAVANCAVYGQPPGYGSQPPQSSDEHGEYGRDRDDDRRYDDDQRYDDDYRGYPDRPTPRGDVGFFYEELSPYGDWVMTRDLGWAWFPRNVHSYWRPYSDGRWVVTEYGWTWVSYEPFGWATYHYGRWAWDPRFGWLWVPGTIWGPAWVSWQHGGGYLGWAPLPPSVGFEIGIGIRLGGLDLSIGIRPDAYSFVPERSFLEARVSNFVVPMARNVTIIHNTTNITNYTYIDNRVINRGVDVLRIEQATGHRVKPLRVTNGKSKARSEVASTEVRIYRPEKKNLETVRVGPRANAGKRAEAPPERHDHDRPATTRRDAPEIEVAPRATKSKPVDVSQLEKQERREKQELAQYQVAEKQRLEKAQKQEVGRARAEADRKQVARQQDAEREELRRGQRDAAQQLDARQKAQRQAVLEKPPVETAGKDSKKAEEAQQDKKKKNTKAQQQQKDKGRGQEAKPPAPPMA